MLFGESEAGAMKVAKNKAISIVSNGPTAVLCAGKKNAPRKEKGEWIEGTSDEVICLAFMLDIGDITEDVCSEYRKKLIYSMLNQGQWGTDAVIEEELYETADVYIKELERLMKYLEDDEEIRIWYSKSAYSLCGLYYVCKLLFHYQNRVYLVELPEYRVIGNTIISYQNWGEIAAEEFASFIEKQREINKHEIKQYATKWDELVEDNSFLRAEINNHVIGVGEDFYDFIIWKKLTEKPVKQARLIGDMLGYYQISVGDWWYAKRIQYFVDKGIIEVLEDSENKYARLIKKK
ncbi:MAG: DUF3658 domain-containing protein [Lachnospiraceae bacterium]|nr:DUF3658 domain-containing protein [Lachnospiraceae bacterium]